MWAWVFPGQGSQYVGMGVQLARESAAARQVLEAVDDALGFALSGVMAEGPEETLRLTVHAQPALMATSLAVVRALESELGKSLSEVGAGVVAGHSLGEYSALCAVGALGLEDTARLLRLRGEAMQAAVPVGVGSMAALMGVDLALAESLVEDVGGVCVVANDNAPGQVVISGEVGAVEAALARARARGVKRAVVLPVSAPFHSPLMAPAAAVMAEALDGVCVGELSLPLISNVTASCVGGAGDVCGLLVEQVSGRVRWRESVLAMEGMGVVEVVELGAGRVLSGLVRRTAPMVGTVAVESMESVGALAAALSR